MQHAKNWMSFMQPSDHIDHDDAFFGAALELDSSRMGVHTDYEYKEDQKEG